MHYTVYVLIPRDTKEIEDEVLSLMDPYCEENEDEESEIRCLCVENQFSKELEELIQRDFGEPRILWKRLMEEKDFGDGEVLWRDVLREYHNFVDTQCARFLETSRPDRDCDECGGTGLKTTRFNFDSRWDFWGWDDSCQIIEGEEPDAERQEPRAYDLRDIDINRIEAPYAVLSPDGWDQRAEWTQHGPVYLPDEIWERTVRRTLEEYKEDHLLIPVDCHV
jgi:hypothetical protein